MNSCRQGTQSGGLSLVAGSERRRTKAVMALEAGVSTSPQLPWRREQKRIESTVSVLLSQLDELSARLRSRQSTTDALIHRIPGAKP